MVTNKPSDLLLAIIEAVCAHHGRLYVPKELYDEIVAVTAKIKTGTATDAEVELVRESLNEIPGYSAWQSRQVLARALRGRKKAFV